MLRISPHMALKRSSHDRSRMLAWSGVTTWKVTIYEDRAKDRRGRGGGTRPGRRGRRNGHGRRPRRQRRPERRDGRPRGRTGEAPRRGDPPAGARRPPPPADRTPPGGTPADQAHGGGKSEQRGRPATAPARGQDARPGGGGPPACALPELANIKPPTG